MDMFDTKMLFEHHNATHGAHPTMNKTHRIRHEVTTIWGGYSIKFIQHRL